MNFKLSWAFAGKLLLALIAGGVLGAWVGETIGATVGVGLCLAVIFAESQKPK